MGGIKKDEVKNYGRVEVMIDGKWGSVCGLYFDIIDAKVFCKSTVKNWVHTVYNQECLSWYSTDLLHLYPSNVILALFQQFYIAATLSK